ncbi:LysM peptidoglycan-binding domain-containing protein [Phycicoccus sp.]|uniref:LysM peptidoglycan-binding domain-containing protein n=1 Tax=Phycicoccus sp. TaxID=1902410 RepID=UPI002CBCB3DE|nr:LysM peptidoglycan-binding domain-containing protein [Phycicoccus sp.]HMM97242.1 LysM peptidoglycan-binding domain-containing protein [Phycicoccus sp.]
MSAIAWEPAELGHPHSAAPRRPHLVVLPGGGEAAVSGGGALRLTARGRLVLLVLAALLVTVLLGLRGQGSATALEPDHVVFVGAGQTLSEIAAHELPQLSMSEGVLAIQLANDLSTAQVSAGQELVIPRG